MTGEFRRATGDMGNIYVIYIKREYYDFKNIGERLVHLTILMYILILIYVIRFFYETIVCRLHQ